MGLLSAKLRYRFLSRAGVRRGLERLPLGSRIAARHREALFDVLAGASRQQALLAAHRSGLLDALAGGERTAPEIVTVTGLAAPAARRLLQWTSACGLVEDLGSERFALTTMGLVAATDRGVRTMIEHGQLLYDDLRDPLAAMVNPGNGRLAAFWPYESGAGEAAAYSQVMRDSLQFVIDPLLAAVDFGKVSRLCEIGGGTGQLAMELATRHPQMQVTIAELDAVVVQARRAIDAAGMATHIAAMTTRDAPAGAYDAVLLARLLHDLDDSAALAMLDTASRLLEPGGVLIIAEPVARPGRDAQTAYFAAYFAAMGSGRLRTAEELESLCRTAIPGLGAPQWSHQHTCSVLQIRHDQASYKIDSR